MPYAHLFRSFQVRLGIPQTFLLVLGYGFGDDHVSRIIENALITPVRHNTSSPRTNPAAIPVRHRAGCFM